MVPQNAQGRPPLGPQQNSFMPGNMGFENGFPAFNMDSAQAAKQFAALSAASQARIAANTRPNPVQNPTSGTNSAPFLGGINPNNFSTNIDPSSATPSSQMLSNGMPHANAGTASFMNPAGHQQTPAAHQQANAIAAMKQRQQGFLASLANVMTQRGTPLPPQLTGVPVPNWDPAGTIWKNLDLSPEIGNFRLGGKDINLMKLFTTVFQSGGGHSVSAKNAWSQIIAQFGLPEEIPVDPPGSGTTSAVQTMKQYYMAMLYPFEQNYKSNLQEQQKRAQLAASQQGGMQASQPSTPARPGFPGNMPPGQPQRPSTGGMGSSGNLPIITPQSPMNGIAQSQASISHQPGTPNNHTQFPPGANGPNFGGQPYSESGLSEQDLQGLKRKIEDDEKDGKRSRQKTEPPEATLLPNGTDQPTQAPTISSPVVTAPVRTRSQPSRRKIEYVPLAREVETHGGRDAKFIEHEMNNIANRRPIRDLSDWGVIDIEALTLSMRSRLSIELAYGITTLSLLSTMRGQEPGAGFPIFNCPDLFDETLDLMEDLAFGGPEEETEVYTFDPQIITHRELVTSIHESEDLPFAGLTPRQGAKDAELGPKQRPGNLVLAIVNIIRNLSIFTNNLEFLWRHPRLVDVMLRVCSVKRGVDGKPVPVSPILSLSDAIDIRQDALYIFISLSNNIHLVSFPAHQTRRMAGRVFTLVSSFLIDPVEAVTPLASVQLAGIPPSSNLKPPSLPDLALEAFDRFGHSDSNRQVFSKAIPKDSLHRLFKALVHRLPVTDADFQLIMREAWLVHLERIVMGIYSLAFLSPPDLKRRIKTDRQLGFKTTMFRMVQKFLMMPTLEARNHFLICARRAVEAMKVLDDGEDSFDMGGKSAGPTMAFGMGFGEAGDTGAEPGTGLLASHRDVAWDMLMTREVIGDEILFKELESLARVEC